MNNKKKGLIIVSVLVLMLTFGAAMYMPLRETRSPSSTISAISSSV